MKASMIGSWQLGLGEDRGERERERDCGERLLSAQKVGTGTTSIKDDCLAPRTTAHAGLESS